MKQKVKVEEMLAHCPGWFKDAVHGFAKENDKKTDELSLVRKDHSEKAKSNQLDPGSRRALKYVSYRTIDLSGEIVIPKGMILDHFMKYAHVLVNHNYSLLPIGSDIEISADDYGIKALTEYADTGEGTLANVVWHLVRQGHMKASSIGFIPLEWVTKESKDWDTVVNKLESEWQEFDKYEAAKQDLVITTKGVLLEHSDVSVPCNADAELITVAKSLVKEADLDDKLITQLGWASVIKTQEPKVEAQKRRVIEIVPPQNTKRVVELIQAPQEQYIDLVDKAVARAIARRTGRLT